MWVGSQTQLRLPPQPVCMTQRVPLPSAFTSQPFTTLDAAIHGLSAGRMRALDLDARYYGIRLETARPVTIEALCRARSLRFPPDAFFSGVTAAILRGVPMPRAIEDSLVLDVTVPEGRRALSGRGIRGHAARIDPEDVVDWRGLRISSATRNWCELGRVLEVHDLVAAGDYLTYRDLPHTTVAALEAALLGFPGQRGRQRLMAAILMLDNNTASRRESHLRVLALQQGLTGFVMNRRIRTSSGFVYYGDLVFVRERVIVEYQSRYHLELEQQKKDMTRRSRLEADDWAVIFVNSDDLRDPRELADRILRVIALHSRHLAGVAGARPTE